MKISEILKRQGLFSKDIKQRFNNGQIKLNGEKVSDIDLDIDPPMIIVDDAEVEDLDSIITGAGTFISKLIRKHPEFIPQLKMLDFETLTQSNIVNNLVFILDKFFLLRFSKKDIIFIEKKIKLNQKNIIVN